MLSVVSGENSRKHAEGIAQLKSRFRNLSTHSNADGTTTMGFIEDSSTLSQAGATSDDNLVLIFDQPSLPREPRPPEIPKASNPLITATHFKNAANFKPYKSTRPALLEELNSMLEKKLHKNAVSEEERMHNFHVYREVFERFIDDFNIYKQFLTSVKHEYDAHIEKYAYEIRTVTSLRSELAAKEQEYSKILKNLERSHEAKIEAVEMKKKAVEVELKEQMRNLKNLQTENARLQEAAKKAIKDFDELRVTCATLTNSLTRLEQERRATQVKDNAKQNEFMALRATAQRSLDEVDRLRRVIHDLEAAQSQMVHQDVVTEKQLTVDSLRADIKSKDMVHKDMIYRYNLLKQTIDAAWSAHVKVAGGARGVKPTVVAKPEVVAAEKAAAAELAEEMKKMDDVLRDPAKTPRVMIEQLLTQVIMLEKSCADSAGGGSGNSGANMSIPGQDTSAMNLDGAVLLTDEEFHTPWNHYVGLGYEETNPKAAAITPSAHQAHHYHHSNPATTTATHHPSSLMSPGAAAGNTTAGSSGGSQQQAQAAESGSSSSSGPPVNSMSHFVVASEGIPKFLQYEGKVQQMFLTKWETETCVNEIWAAKEEHDSNKVRPAETFGYAHDFDPKVEVDTSFADFYWGFIERKFNYNVAKAIAFSYNFLDSLKKYSYDADCKIFLLVLQGQLAEHIRQEQLNLVENIQAELLREETSHCQELTYTLPVLTFNKIIRRVLSHKTEQSFIRLEKALTLENKGNRVVNYMKLLGEDESGNQGHYCEMLRSQHLQESIHFTEHIVHMIMQARPHHSTKELPLGVIREAIVKVDSNKPRSDLNRYLARGVHMTVEDMLRVEQRQEPVNLALFLRRLKRGVLFPSPVPGKK